MDYTLAGQTKTSKTKSVNSAKSGGSLTMDDLLKSFSDKVHGYKRGDRVEGIVTGISSKQVTVDIGGKSEAMVAEKAYIEAKDFIRKLKVGDKVTANVIIPETYDGVTILSFRHTAQNASWNLLESAMKNDTPINVTGRNVNQSGVMVDIEGLTGFVPISQLGREAAKNPQGLINAQFKVLPIDIDREMNKIVLSEKAVSDAEEIKQIRKAIETIKIGEIYDGTVSAITNFGCFVTIQKELSKKEVISVDGLVHISELSWDKVSSASEIVDEGDKVKVKIIGKDHNKLSFSTKQVDKDPWEKVAQKYQKDAKVKGTATKITDYGVFVQLEEGVEGLVHMTKIPPGKKYEKGDPVSVYVEEVDLDNRKISLGLVLTAKPVGYR
ncbi:30S ribosomal protein S1 [Candidatus Woesebacteria bacterium]|nr:MAG: 30S ribosomal protein S1 [Candidatus Woesebacteria bacterium]